MADGQGEIVIAVDVGSTSARAGVIDRDGRLVASAATPFDVHRPESHHAEHDSDQIWSSVCSAVGTAMTRAGAKAADVGGLAFDATCSLVMLDAAGRPATVSRSDDDRWNVIMWSDHRAVAEAAEITATRHRVLDYVGGVMSPEMQLPKLLWLKRKLPAAWARFARALDLADFLTWRSTSETVASACTVTCKWTYLNHEPQGWQRALLDQLGLDNMLAKLAVPATAKQIGSRAGTVTAAAAAELGLSEGTPVGVGLIDAHAGGLGLLAGSSAHELQRRLALIAGTSNCHMVCSPSPRPIQGVWGPYFGAMLPGAWLNEGGQSATGAMLDHILDWHAEGRRLDGDRHARVTAHIEQRLLHAGDRYGRDMLVVPDFNGNRSPFADPHMRGLIHGLELDNSFDSLARLYLAAARGIGYGTRQIIDSMNHAGYRIGEILMTGGHSKSELLVQIYADTTGCDVVLPREADAVLLGSGLSAAVAAGWHPNIETAGKSLVHYGRRIRPSVAGASIETTQRERFNSLAALSRRLSEGALA